MDHPKFRNNAEGDLLINFGNYGEEVEVAALSGNGRRILTVRDVDTAQVWDADSRASWRLADLPACGYRRHRTGRWTFEVYIESAALNSDDPTRYWDSTTAPL